MNTRASLGLGLAVTVMGVGCLTSNIDTISAEEEAKALAAALLSDVDFEGGSVVDGELPDSDADDLVIAPLSTQVVVSPGMTSIMAIEVDNADEADDPVIATLIQMKNASGHVEVPTQRRDDAAPMPPGDGDGDGDGDVAPTKRRIDNSFTAKLGICDKLCNKIFATEVSEVAKRRSGSIGKRNRRTLVLDCREAGKRNRCADNDDDDVPAETLAEMMMDPPVEREPGVVDGGSGVDEPVSACASELLEKVTDPPTGCAECLCEVDEEAVSACDAGCWAFIACISDNCAEDDIECISARCAGDSIGVDQTAVMAVSDVLPACEAECAGEKNSEPVDPAPDAGIGVPVLCEDVAVPSQTDACRSCLCRFDEPNASACDSACEALLACGAPCLGDDACISETCAEEVRDVGDVTATNAVGALMTGMCMASCLPADAGQ